MRVKQITFLLLLSLTSCEGFKVLKLYNASDKDIIITTQPGLTTFIKDTIANYPYNSSLQNSTIILKPDSSAILTSIFTSKMFNVKIHEWELRIDYLKIQTPTDTIEAKNKIEIIKLLTDSMTRYNPTTDTRKTIINSKNVGNIIIRK
ncbi:MAG: hypothetical protein HY840_12785 [Bacteroidetes bacterium]|nr:hypothetical protein [Bacteroidota bacterium]